MSAERVRSYLDEHGVSYETHSHPVAYTTSEVAEADEISGSEMAKVVLLEAGGELMMAVVPGDKMVDLEKAARAIDVEELRLAEEADFSPAFPDCEAGAEPPFGALYDIPTIVDNGLNTRITFNAGSHTETITMDLDDYLELAAPKRADLTIGS